MRLRCNHEQSIRKIDNEVFIYDRHHSLIHTFNETGVVIWNALEANLSNEQIIERLVNEYDTDESAAKKDLDSFLQVLAAAGLIA